MKRFLLILIVLLVSSCVKNYIIDEPFISGHYHSECTVGNVGYYSNFNVVRDSVEMYLIRTEKVTLYVSTYNFENYEYYYNKDTLYVDTEIYNYKIDEFKNILINKNMLPRDTTIFKITLNMYCTWKCFDEMYNIYVKD